MHFTTGKPTFARDYEIPASLPAKSKTSEDENESTVPPLDKIPTNEFIEKFLEEDDDGRQLSRSGDGVALLTEFEVPDKDSEREDDTDTIRHLRPKVTVEPLPDDNDDLETMLDETENRSLYDGTGQRAYSQACNRFGALTSKTFHKKLGYATQIDMRHYGTGPRGAQAIAIPMMINTKVTTLNLKNNGLSKDGVRYITRMMAENDSIIDLDLSDNNLRTYGARLVAQMISENTTLRKLNLSGNNFVDGDARILARPFEEHTDLKTLDLSNNGFGDNACPYLRRLISECQSLQEIDLSWNTIRMKGGSEIAKGVKENVGLKVLDVSWNGFGDDGAKELGEALKTSTLTHLDLTCNRVGTDGFLALLRGLKDNDDLRVLKLGRNPIPEESAIAGVEYLKTLDELCLQSISLAEIVYCREFKERLVHLRDRHPSLEFEHGYTDSYGKRKLKQYNVVEEALGAMTKYCVEMNMKLVDLFARFDDDGSMSVTHEEFKEGLRDAKIPLTALQVEELINALDEDGDGEIDFSELVMGAEKYGFKD